MHTFKLKILTPDSKLFDGSVLKVVVPTQAGEITVLKNHAPLITLISIGELIVTDENKTEHKFLVQGGVVDVKESVTSSEVVILADLTINANEEVDFDQAIARAKEAMELKKEEYDYAFEEATIERNLFLKRFKGR